MSYRYYLALFFWFLTGCNSQEKQKKLRQIEFLHKVKEENGFVTVAQLKQADYLTFSFHQNYYLLDLDTCDYSRSLYITIPVTDSSFSFEQDSSHFFNHVVSNVRGLFPTPLVEEITKANITGKLIENGKWEIEAKTKYFDFKRIVTVSPDKLEIETIRL